MKESKEVKKSSEEYDKLAILENTADCIWVYSLAENRFLYISPAIYTQRGFTVEEAMKETLESSMTSESIQKILNASNKCLPRFLAGDRSEEVTINVSDFEVYCKDGSIKNIEVSTRLILNENTRSVDIIGVSRDITRRKQYENELLEKLRSLSETEASYKVNDIVKICIQFFKKFSVYGPGNTVPIRWTTLKNEELLAFLLTRTHNCITKDEILESLWPEVEFYKAGAYLHNTLYSMKKDLKNAGIFFETVFKNGCYTYYLDDYYSDLLHFSKLIQDTVLPFDSVDDIARVSLEKIVELYTGDFLEKNGYLWAHSDCNFYRTKFNSAALALSKYYFMKRNYNAAKRVLLKILEVDYSDEYTHELLLQVYLQDNDYIAFLRHYNELKNYLQRELQITPKTTIQNLYNRFYPVAMKITEEKTSFF